MSKKFQKIMLLFSIPAVIGIFVIAVWNYNDARSLPIWLIYGVLIYAIVLAACMFVQRIWTKRELKEQEEKQEDEQDNSGDEQ